YLHSQFSTACDTFLEIIHHVDALLKQTLKHDTPNWWLLNVCPPCTCKLVDESPLQITWPATIVSNNNLKCWVSSIHSSVPHDDFHQPRLDYWIGHDVVDKFKDKVRSRTALNQNDNVDNWKDVHDDREVPGEIPFHCI
ncbi:hypothetical protein F4604DRAFT_1525077, partial [Suillus subluteus]